MDKNMIVTKEEAIHAISQASDRYGNKLIELMQECNTINLASISAEQAHSYCKAHAIAVTKSPCLQRMKG